MWKHATLHSMIDQHASILNLYSKNFGYFSLNYGRKRNFVRACGHLGQLTVNVTEHFARYVDFASEKGRQ